MMINELRANQFNIQLMELISDLFQCIITFEDEVFFFKKIQKLKLKLAANDHFDSRIAYFQFDREKKGFIDHHDFKFFLGKEGRESNTAKLQHIDLFICKFCEHGQMNYSRYKLINSFIKLLCPKSSRPLSQILLKRCVKMAKLPDFLFKLLHRLFILQVVLCKASESIKLKIVEQTNIFQIQPLLSGILSSQKNISSFLRCTNKDINQEQAKALSYHSKHGKIKQFDETVLRQLLFPHSSLIMKPLFNFIQKQISESDKGKQSPLYNFLDESVQDQVSQVYQYKQKDSSFSNLHNKKHSAQVQSKRQFTQELQKFYYKDNNDSFRNKYYKNQKQIPNYYIRQQSQDSQKISFQSGKIPFIRQYQKGSFSIPNNRSIDFAKQDVLNNFMMNQEYQKQPTTKRQREYFVDELQNQYNDQQYKRDKNKTLFAQ